MIIYICNMQLSQILCMFRYDWPVILCTVSLSPFVSQQLSIATERLVLQITSFNKIKNYTHKKMSTNAWSKNVNRLFMKVERLPLRCISVILICMWIAKVEIVHSFFSW